MRLFFYRSQFYYVSSEIMKLSFADEKIQEPLHRDFKKTERRKTCFQGDYEAG